MIWIGDRTRQPDGAHVEFCPRRAEPDRAEMRPVDDDRRPQAADGDAEPRKRARPADPDRALRRRQGRRPPAAADPRGRRRRAPRWSGPATRCTATRSSRPPATRPGRSTAVLREVREFFAVHNAEGTIPGGVHFEMTGQDVTECTGGVRAVTDEDLSRPLPHRLRPAAQRQPVAGTGLPGGRGAFVAPRDAARRRALRGSSAPSGPHRRTPRKGPGGTDERASDGAAPLIGRSRALSPDTGSGYGRRGPGRGR